MKTRIEQHLCISFLIKFLKVNAIICTILCLAPKQSYTQNENPISYTERIASIDNQSSLDAELGICNAYSSIIAQNLTLGGPLEDFGCQAGDTIEICFIIHNWVGDNGQWMHGLVPDFGNCLDVFPNDYGEPGLITYHPFNNISYPDDYPGPHWKWFPEFSVFYNDIPNGYYPPNTPLGGGWFYVNLPGNNPECLDYSDPNCSWGEYFSPEVQKQVCFLATPTPCSEPGIEYCEISFRTFGDGETGGWMAPGCQEDEPWTLGFIKRCCDPPIILNEEVEFEVCSGDLFELDLISNMDPETTYEWYVAPNPHGATSGTGSTISNVLTNTTGNPVTVVYYVTPTCLLGCIGEQLIVTVTIFPEIDFYIDPTYSNICPGECAQLTAVISSGTGPFSCIWSNGIDGPESIVACNAGYYSVTVTDANGCTNESGAFVEETYPPLVNIEASPGIEACENGPGYPITLSANTFGGSGFYYYMWSSGGNDQTELAFESGTYTVTVYDGGSGCYEVFADISITIFPEPHVEISGPTTICNNEPPLCFEASPLGGTWDGPVDINGCIDPQSLGIGIHTLSYNFIDINGCESSMNYEIEIIEAVEQPDQLSDVFICENGNTEVYVISDVPFATSYEWTINGSGTIISGQGTTSIEVVWQSPGGQVCVHAIGDCGPGMLSCFNVEVQEIPLADFSSPDFICEDDVAFINFNGTIDFNTTLIWDFGSGTVVNGNPDSGIFDLQFPSGQHIITLQVERNGCLSSLFSKTIQVDPAILEPQITCISTVDVIEFYWAPVPNVTSYIVNGQIQNGTNYTISNLPPNEQVSITVEAISNGICPNSFTQIDCSTLECPNISLNIQNIQSFCSNELPLGNIELEVEIIGDNGLGNGTWSGPGIMDSNNGIFNPSSNQVSVGTNEIIYTYQEGYCTYSEILIINIMEAPQVEAGESLILNCIESEQTIIGSGIGIPIWEGPSIASGEGTFSPTVTAPGIYTLTTTDPLSGCSSSDFVEIFEDINIPIALIGGDQMLTCAVTECLLTSIGNTQDNLIPQWEGPGINSSNVNSPIPLVTIPGTYTLSILNTENGCLSDPEFVNVFQDIEPPIAETIVQGIFDCASNSVVIKPAYQDDVVYSWILPDGSIINEFSIEVFEPGTYTLIATSLTNGCSANEEVVISDLSNNPEIDAGDDKEITCYNSEVILDGENSETGPEFQYFWNGPPGGIIGPNNQIEVTAIFEGMYVLRVTNSLNGCFSEDTVFVSSNTLAPIIDAGQEQSFGCTESTLVLNGSASSDADEFVWNFENENIISTDLITEISNPGWYTLTAFNSLNGCFNVDSVFISENEDFPYQINFNAQGPSCYGNNDGFIEMQSVLGGTPPFQYSIDNQTFTTISYWQFLESGVYNLTVQDALGCALEQTVIVPENTPIEIDLGSDITVELGQNIELFLQTNIAENQIESVKWTPTEALTCLDQNCLNISINPLNTTSYQVMLEDTSGCFVEDEIMVRVKKNRNIFIPNVFTPNNDGVNDVFKIFPGKDVKEIRNLKIFNRWGELVFEIPQIIQGNGNNSSIGWDGTLNGEPLNPGVFVYVIDVKYIDGHVDIFRGDITLVR